MAAVETTTTAATTATADANKSHEPAPAPATERVPETTPANPTTTTSTTAEPSPSFMTARSHGSNDDDDDDDDNDGADSAGPSACAFETNDELPTRAALEAVADSLVLDAQGTSRPFRSVYAGGEGVAPRQLVIFIRHFFCGNCQEYLRTLASRLTAEMLLSLPTPTFVTAIGCGRPELIPMYQAVTGWPFPLYADPSRRLYGALGMGRTLDMGPAKPEYIHGSTVGGIVSSIVQGIRQGSGAVKGGDFKQVGGEFLFEEGVPVWCHRMRHTRDHAEVDELRRVLGLDGEREEKLQEKEQASSSSSPVQPLKKRPTWTEGFRELARTGSWRAKNRDGAKGRGKREESVASAESGTKAEEHAPAERKGESEETERGGEGEEARSGSVAEEVERKMQMKKEIES